MKTLILTLGLMASFPAFGSADSLRKLVETAENQIRGKTFQADVEMKVEHDGSVRTLGLKIWTEGRDKATVKVTAPKKERGSGNLRMKLDLWQYSPNTDMIIKIPPSLMLQSWMGSDFTNDDLVRTSSLANDYTHSSLGKDAIFGRPALKVNCVPKPEAVATWGKVILWIDEKETVPVKQEFYSENGELLKVLEGRELKTFGSHTIPTIVTMTSVRKKNAKTTMIYSAVVFDATVAANIFTQTFLRRAVGN